MAAWCLLLTHYGLTFSGKSPPLDISSLSPGRFGPGPLDDDELTAADLWRYANYYNPQPVG